MRGTDGQRLVEAYDLAMFDLDGVVYVGDRAVPGAAEHLAAVRETGVHVAHDPNNVFRFRGTVCYNL